jgi:CrcB protein
MTQSVIHALAIGTGGFFGSLARWGVNNLSNKLLPHTPALGTFIANISGCFIIGFVYTMASARAHFSPTLRLAIGVGFVGAYTTFSSLMYESITLYEVGARWTAAINIVASVIIGLFAVMLGAWLAPK